MTTTPNDSRAMQLDAFIPAEMARRAEQVGVTKATMPVATVFALAVLAGAFIGLGAMFATVATTGTGDSLPFGVTKLLGGFVFSLGLILVIVAGAELFTGNNLIVMAVAGGKVTYVQLLRNWLIVYVGNFVGSLATAGLVFVSGQYTFAGGRVGTNALAIADAKCGLGFVQAISLGMLCNVLVCLAVWLCFSARSTTDKILAIIFPITAFVAAGFEHSVANMYFIPLGLFIKTSLADNVTTYGNLTWNNFFVSNLLPVTIGNIIGGALMVGIVYWFIYLRPASSPPAERDS
jgi:formate/nitrite transporter